LREIDEIRVKGRRGAGVIYELLGERSAASEEGPWLEAYAEGLAEYRSGRWPAARETFERVLAARGEDGPSSALIERIEALGGVPPDGWTGIWTFETK
jgi:adenylate cyclase